MFVSIIFDTEYMGMGERIKWFLKNLSKAKENEIFIITHEYLDKNHRELFKNCGERFYEEFEMRKISEEEYNLISKAFVPDRIFENIEKKLITRTNTLMYLSKQRYYELEACLISLINEELKRRKETKVEAIFNCCECWESIRFLKKQYGCPVIPYVFSAIRKVHGYQQTLYSVNENGTLYSDAESKRRFEEYKKIKNICVYSYKELLVLFGKICNIPLIKYLDNIPIYEAGICSEAFRINPNAFIELPITDDDLYYECNKHFPKEKIISRIHPLHYTQMGASRENVKNDPASFMLSCKRIIGSQSQILLKAMLWKRAVCMKGNTLDFSFLCSKDFTYEKPVDIEGLNFFIFSYLIPDKLMFDVNYWRWRLTNPKEEEIYKSHLDFYFKEFKLDAEIMKYCDEEKRFIYLLKQRKCKSDLIDDLLNQKDDSCNDYSVAMSRIDILYRDSGRETVYRCNSFDNNKIYSKYSVHIYNVEKIHFYPFVDVAGTARIYQIKINQKNVSNKIEDIYFPKTNGYIEWENTEGYNMISNVEFIWEREK